MTDKDNTFTKYLEKVHEKNYGQRLIFDNITNFTKQNYRRKW